MSKKTMITALICACLLFTGCQSAGGNGSGEKKEGETEKTEQTASSSIELKKDGSVTETIAEDFSMEYYDTEELKNYIISEVADYNNNGEKDNISVDRFEEKDGFIYVTMTYPSSESYADYNSGTGSDKTLFVGTVAEAYDAGMNLDVTLLRVKNREETIGKEELLGMGDSHIFISVEPVAVKVFGRITYVSENVAVSGKNRAQLLADESPGGSEETADSHYIVF